MNKHTSTSGKAVHSTVLEVEAVFQVGDLLLPLFVGNFIATITTIWQRNKFYHGKTKLAPTGCIRH